MSVQRPVHKAATHKATHVTVHKTVHKTTHKTTTKKSSVKKKPATRRVGFIQPNGLLLNDVLPTCALLAWWKACTFAHGDLIATPSDDLVFQEYKSLCGNADEGLYLESVLERAANGLFGYRLVNDGDILIGSIDDHAFGGDDAIGVDLDQSWSLNIVPI